MTANSSTLALAAWLRALDDSALTALLRLRGTREAGIRDRFDLAEALLDPLSIHAALARLDRPTLSLLAASSILADTPDEPDAQETALRSSPSRDAARHTLTLAGLVDEREEPPLPWDPVREVLRGWPSRGLPSMRELLDTTPPAALELVGRRDHQAADRGAGDRAFVAVTAVSEILGTLENEPARLLQRGGITLPDWRRLLGASGAENDETLAILLSVADNAGLVETGSRTLHATETGRTWRSLPRVDRWTTLAEGWLARVPRELRQHLRSRAHARWGEGLLDYLSWLYPAGGNWIPERARAAAKAAELIGILAENVPSTPGSTLLAEGTSAAAKAIEGLFPPDVRQLYLQHDLSLIAPGPLAADIDHRLRELADVESAGVASTFRITAASVTRALTAGHTVEELRSFLSEISLTGIPQPLDYLLTETAGRFGSLRVGALNDPETPQANAYIRGDDAALIGQLVIDQALGSIGLHRSDENRAVSRLDAETVYWSLVDARYPVVYEDADGAIRSIVRSAPARTTAPPPADTAAILVARIREAEAEQPAESGEAWNARQLELAIRGKLTVTVTVRMPDGTEVPYVLEPAALAGGRLRARDRRADIERTLPLSHIVGVSPA